MDYCRGDIKLTCFMENQVRDYNRDKIRDYTYMIKQRPSSKSQVRRL